MIINNPTLVQDRKSFTLPWVLFIFLFMVFFLATPYDIFRSVNIAGNEEEVMRQVDLGVLSQNNLMRSLALFAFAVFSLVSLMRKRRCHLRINGLLGWLILSFLFIAFFSIAWADDRVLTLKKLLVLIVFCLGSISLADRLSLIEIIYLVFFLCGITLLLGIVSEIVLGTFHPLTPGYYYAGVMYPNISAWNLAMLIVASSFLYQTSNSHRLFFLIVVLFSFVFLTLTKSRTPFYSVILALIFCGFIVFRKSTIAFITLISFLMLIILFLFFEDQLFYYGGNIVLLGRESQHLNTLTGRIPHWEYCLSYIFERPLLGYGYNGFWTAQHISIIYKKSELLLPNAHNAYLEVALSIGIFSSMIYILIISCGIWKSIKLYLFTNNICFCFITGIFAWLSLNMMMESLNVGVFFHKLLFMTLLAKLAFFKVADMDFHTTKMNKV